MLMLYLLLELCSILVETFGRAPQSQKTIVRRPLKYESIWIYSVCCDYVWTGMHAAFYSGICIQIAG